MVLGCGNALLTTSPGHIKQGGCTSLCGKSPALEQPCNGINCCEIYPGYDHVVQTYQVNFTNLPGNACNYAFFVHEDWFAKSFPGSRPLLVPVVWRWKILNGGHYLPPSSSSYTCHNEGYMGWYCDCQYPKQGNPYFPNGCQGPKGGRKLSVKELSAIIGVSASFGSLMLISACFILYKAIKKRKMKKQRQKFFRRNGGLLLQQQLLAKEGAIEKAKIFTASDLDKATDHINSHLP